MESLLCDVDEGKKEAVKRSMEDTFEEFPLFACSFFPPCVFFLLSLFCLFPFYCCLIGVCFPCQRFYSSLVGFVSNGSASFISQRRNPLLFCSFINIITTVSSKFYQQPFPFFFFLAKVSFFCDPTVSVVFCCSDPHLVMTYDSVIGLHSLWEITKAKPEVCSVKSVCFSVDVILRARKVSLPSTWHGCYFQT